MKKAVKKVVNSLRVAKTSSDAIPSRVTNEQSFITDLSSLAISTHPDEIDEAARAAKAWDEPTYNKTKPPPIDLQQNQDIGNTDLLEENKTPLNIKVEKGTKFFGNPLRMYPMYSCPRGYALIINNQEFDNPDMFPFRKGAHVDGENLERLYTELGFKVMSYMNLKRNATLKKLIEFSEIAGSESVDMMIVCILSHGMEHGKIISADGYKIDTETDVLRRFNNDYCPELKGKPKFFIIQACRGEEQDYGIVFSPTGDVTTDAVPRGGRPISLIQREVSWEDMLIAYSTLPGYVCNRDHYRGTWFIESICKVFMEHAKDMNLRDMLDEVGFVLSRYESEMGTKQSFNYDVRHFYKKLFFNPGINIAEREQWKHASSSEFNTIQAQEMKAKAEDPGSRKMNRQMTISVSEPYLLNYFNAFE